MNDEGGAKQSGLAALQPKRESKASRFRRLAPAILAKVGEGVEHAEIIRTLREQGVELSDATYFNYLARYRRAARARRIPASAAQERPPAPLPPTVAATSQDSDRRPPTFDYDPRGIPDLLK